MAPALASSTTDNRTHLESSVNPADEKEEAMLVSQSPELANIHIISFLNLKHLKYLEAYLKFISLR